MDISKYKLFVHHVYQGLYLLIVIMSYRKHTTDKAYAFIFIFIFNLIFVFSYIKSYKRRSEIENGGVI